MGGRGVQRALPSQGRGPGLGAAIASTRLKPPSVRRHERLRLSAPLGLKKPGGKPEASPSRRGASPVPAEAGRGVPRLFQPPSPWARGPLATSNLVLFESSETSTLLISYNKPPWWLTSVVMGRHTSVPPHESLMPDPPPSQSKSQAPWPKRTANLRKARKARGTSHHARSSHIGLNIVHFIMSIFGNCKMSRTLANRISLLICIVWVIYGGFTYIIHCDVFPEVGSGIYCNWDEIQIYYSADSAPVSYSVILLQLIGPPLFVWAILRAFVWAFQK